MHLRPSSISFANEPPEHKWDKSDAHNTTVDCTEEMLYDAKNTWNTGCWI